MKILHVISSMNPLGGGPAEGVRQLGTLLEGAGHQVHILSLDSPDAPYLAESAFPVHPMGPGKFKYGYSRRFTDWLRANHRRYDVVVVNGIWQYHSYGAWRVLRNSDTPYVLFTHGMLDPWFKTAYPLKHLKKWAYWPWGEYPVLRDAQAVLFTCEEERRLARASFWLYRCNEIVVSYGTAKPRGNPESELQEFFVQYPELRGKKLALFMGRIHPKKGCDLLIEAFANILGPRPDWQLVMAGPDQVGWQKQLDERAGQLGLGGRLTWTGMLGGKQKWGAIRASEVFVLPSHQENFGIAVAEALSLGVPTLISDKVNIWREIQDDGAGLVAEDTLQGACNLLKSYIDMPQEKQRAMRRAAVDCFDRRFEIKHAAERFHRVLSSVIIAN